MPSPARTSSSSSSLTPVSLGLATALKIAQEACNDVPIARQILGSAVCIVELAQRFDKNKDSMRALADRSALLAQRIAQVATGRALDEAILQRLDNLRQVFIRIEAFMEKESAISGRTQRIIRTLFVTPRLVEQLAADLQTEIGAFLLTASVDLAHNHARYDDGGFRILRDADVRKLGVIAEVETPDEVVVYAKARVDNEIMVLMYTTPLREPATPQTLIGTNPKHTCAARRRHNELLLKTSTVSGSHPYVAQFYGRGVSGSTGEFRVMRAGVQLACDYLRNLDPHCHGRRIRTACEIYWKLLDATYYLKRELQIDWRPWGKQGEYDITVNDEGEPMIGLNEQLGDATQETGEAPKYRCLSDFVVKAGILSASYSGLDPQWFVASWTAQVLHWNDERLAAVSSLSSTLTMAEDYYAKYRRIDFPIWDRPLDIHPDVFKRIDALARELGLLDAQELSGPDTDGAENRLSAIQGCQTAVITNLALSAEEVLWSWSYIVGDEVSIIRFDRAWTNSVDCCRSLDVYDIHLSASNRAAFESAMGLVREPDISDYCYYKMRSSWEPMQPEQ